MLAILNLAVLYRRKDLSSRNYKRFQMNKALLNLSVILYLRAKYPLHRETVFGDFKEHFNHPI